MNHGNTITDHFDIITGRCVADMAYSSGWGYYPSGGLGLVLVVIIVLLLMGRIAI
jgi:hypothetical protein